MFVPTGCRPKPGSRITPVKARPAFIGVETRKDPKSRRLSLPEQGLLPSGSAAYPPWLISADAAFMP
jgi:hypothetical protein